MEYFIKFIESKDHLPFVLFSYLIVFLIMGIIFLLSLKKLKKFEKILNELEKK